MASLANRDPIVRHEISVRSARLQYKAYARTDRDSPANPLTLNQRVLGSSPSALTIFPSNLDHVRPSGRPHIENPVIT